MWDDDKSEARGKVIEFLNSQHLRIAKEIDQKPNKELVGETQPQKTRMAQKINDHHPKLK